MHVNDYLTYIENEEDVPYLRTKLLDVNMRLFKSSRSYRHLIRGCCDYISKLALTEMDGYKKPYGMSGANVGIPFNIIGVIKERETANERCQIMINPKITTYYGELIESLSNCGSIRLPAPVLVPRHTKILVEWYDVDGNKLEKGMDRKDGSLTIQHEVDHNNGVLITDLASLPF